VGQSGRLSDIGETWITAAAPCRTFTGFRIG
jgi:hypothetical protein